MWTTQEVGDLSPNQPTRIEGYMLADLRKWSDFGLDSEALWGVCQDGKKACQTEVRLTGQRTYHCTCRAALAPCKHAVALMFLRGQEKLPEGPRPEWLLGWQKKTAKASKPAAPKLDKAAVLLREWLESMVAQGLAHAPTLPTKTWNDLAKKMGTLGANGVSQQIAAIPALLRQPGWADLLARHFGRLYRLLEAERHSEAQFLFSGIQDPALALATPPAREDWVVAGVHTDGRFRRTWLWRRSGRPALLVEQASTNEGLPAPLTVGTAVDAEVSYYPGSPHRAHAEGVRTGTSAPLEDGFTRCRQVVDSYREELSGNSWLEGLPVLLHEVRLLGDWIVDASWQSLPMDGQPARLRSLTSGKPFDLFGEWNGYSLQPLTLIQEGAVWEL